MQRLRCSPSLAKALRQHNASDWATLKNQVLVPAARNSQTLAIQSQILQGPKVIKDRRRRRAESSGRRKEAEQPKSFSQVEDSKTDQALAPASL
ncbi:hypothetical protein WJX73_010463 [Symbiochloris irregularis]|uniref:Uncharacterized protein n=1 Tax=Symbiochloris irregularis TaxID=706552 RepID=A0AAW1PHZ6_9CHLO